MSLFGVVVFLLATAWFHIQATRLGYKTQRMRLGLDQLGKKEQIIDQKLQKALSLSRLDELAKNRFGLQVPDPSQIVLLTETVS